MLPQAAAGRAIQKVRLYFGGTYLDDTTVTSGGAGRGPDIWGFHLPNVPAGAIPAGLYLMEVEAVDTSGEVSDRWPYLYIH